MIATPQVQLLGQRRHRHAEVAGHGVGEQSVGAASVHVPSGVPERLTAQPAAATPVSRDGPDREEPDPGPVRAHPDGIHPGAADHGHRVRLVGAGAQQREKVVVDVQPTGGPRQPGQRFPVGVDLCGQVEAGEVHRGLPHSCPAGHLADERVDQRDRSPQPDVVGTASGATGAADDLAVQADGDRVGLGAAAVHGDDHGAQAHGRNLAFSASSRSVSRSARSCCRTSGCARIARSTRSRPPCTAASRASRS